MKNLLLFIVTLCIIAALVLWWNPKLRKESDNLLRYSGLKPASVILYKWQDNRGVWQYTQDSPPDGVHYTEVEARSDVNVLPLPEQLNTD